MILLILLLLLHFMVLEGHTGHKTNKMIGVTIVQPPYHGKPCLLVVSWPS
jgi:hypothetical protein